MFVSLPEALKFTPEHKQFLQNQEISANCFVPELASGNIRNGYQHAAALARADSLRFDSSSVQ